MNRKEVGRARRSSLVSTYGVGSLFPADQDSVMIAGLDDWPKGEIVIEARLAESLGVHEFRAPSTWRKSGDIPVVRFPEWALCPKCRRLGPHWTLVRKETHLCSNCLAEISPSRFVACCVRGHIEDFPYLPWAHDGEYVTPADHQLKLNSRGHSSALSDLVVACSCGRSRSLGGVFDVSNLRSVRSCGGRRPWLTDASDEACDQPLRVLQRGSSSVWFSITRSVISIPSPKNRARDFVERKFKGVSADAPADTLATLFPLPEGCTTSDVAAAIQEMRVPAASRERPTEEQLRAEEYRALVNGLTAGPGTNQFLCQRQEIVGSGLPALLAQVSKVARLREVRALHGFSRVKPYTGENGDGHLSPITLNASPDWYPAIEVLGEGIFLRLDEERLKTWESSVFALERLGRLLSVGRINGLGADTTITARRLAMHSLAHLLIDELSLTGGYPAASLRERLYDETGQAGILIYTATADSAGSLGGLAEQSYPRRLASVLKAAVLRAGWCTSDPVCIESGPSGAGGLNLAACHACLLMPETSCERFNSGLDRATLIGDPERYEGGLLSEYFR